MPSENRPLRVVLDTNVLFSALGLARNNPPLQILELVRSGVIEGFSSPFILAELERNLKENLDWDDERLALLRRKLRLTFGIVNPPVHIHVIKNANPDNRILECAVDAHADVLITGDLKDIRPLGTFHGVAILTPREFLDKYFPHP